MSNESKTAAVSAPAPVLAPAPAPAFAPVSSPAFTPGAYLRDRAAQIAVLVVTVVLLAAALAILGLNGEAVFLACSVVVVGFAIAMAMDYGRKRAFYHDMQEVCANLQRVRHLSAFLSEPSFLEGLISFDALDSVAAASDNEMRASREAEAGFQQYVNLWIHEVKTPIAASKLILARLKGPDATALRQELESIERQVEQVLFALRSATLSTDYAIRRAELAPLAREACKRNQNLLISSGVSVGVDVPEDAVAYVDQSWLVFVLGQLLTNSAKYGAKRVDFTAWQEGEGVEARYLLQLADNGWGIPAQDMPQIFQQGFVGSNGRAQGSATGMGLFLCARMCRAMGLGIEVFSEEGKGTRVVLSIPTNNDVLGGSRSGL